MLSSPKLISAHTAKPTVGHTLVKLALCLSRTAKPVSNKPATTIRNHGMRSPRSATSVCWPIADRVTRSACATNGLRHQRPAVSEVLPRTGEAELGEERPRHRQAPDGQGHSDRAHRERDRRGCGGAGLINYSILALCAWSSA